MGLGFDMASEISVTLVHGEAESYEEQSPLIPSGRSAQVWCSVCTKSFKWTCKQANETPSRYCSRACRTRVQRNWNRGLFLKCPTPDKKRYQGSEEALEKLNEYRKTLGVQGQTVYACQCGVYHLGHGNWVLLKEDSIENTD